MPPALLLLRFGRPRWLAVPLPVFLMWPLFALAWIGVGLAWLATSGRSRPDGLVAGVTALRVLNEVRGTEIDLRGRHGSIYLRFI